MPGGVGIRENNVGNGRVCTAGFNVQDTNGANAVSGPHRAALMPVSPSASRRDR
jgi:hypothetical protein